MSKYTTEVRYICETKADYHEGDEYNVNEILSVSAPLIFDQSLPIFDENYRLPLEIKILKHFYTREIGFETYGLWKLKLNTKLGEILPYYNQLYSSELLEFNPFYDVDMSRVHNLQREENASGSRDNDVKNNRISHNENTNNKVAQNESSTVADNTTDDNRNDVRNDNNRSKDKYSDTPQGSIQNIENDTYLTNARIIEQDNSSANVSVGKTVSDYSDTVIGNNVENNESVGTNVENGNTLSNETHNQTINSVDSYIEHVTGKASNVSYSAKLIEFRKTFMNIDMMIIKDLEELFFALW